MKLRGVTPFCAHQLDEPLRTSPVLIDDVCGIIGTKRPAHLATMTSLKINDVQRELPVFAELGDDLLI